MRTVAGVTFLAALFALAGVGVLHAIRPFAVRPVRAAVTNVVASLGLAYLVGVSTVLVAAIALRVVGVTLSLPAFTGLVLAIAATGIAIGVLRETEPAPPNELVARAFPARIDRLFLLGAVVVVGGYLLLVLPQYTSAPMAEWDSWSIWARKGIALFELDGLLPAFWSAKPYAFMHQDYPILLPMLESLHYKVIGRIDTQSVHVQLWLLLLAFPWAMGYLAARAGRAALWAPIVLGATLVPAVATVMIGGLADVPVALFIGAAALAMGLWVDTRERFYLVVSVLLLAGAASIKNEGLLAAVVILVVAGVVSLRERPLRPLRDLAVGAAVWLVAIAPWQIWAARAGVPKDVNAADGLNPIYLAKHIDRMWPAVKALEVQIADEGRWSWFIPLFLVVVVLALLVRHATRAAAFYLLCAAGVFAGLVWAYWASPHPLAIYLAQSAFRVVDGLAAVTMAGLAHLAPRLATLAPFAGMPAEPTDDEAAALEAGKEPAPPAKRERVPAGLLAFWRA